jgi:hypothetical protein
VTALAVGSSQNYLPLSIAMLRCGLLADCKMAPAVGDCGGVSPLFRQETE